jgi:hypothetical protein
MPIIYETMIAALCAVVQSQPIGTNRGLFSLLWMMVSGRLLGSRGGVFPALLALGLSSQAVRRAWGALACGKWTIEALLRSWESYVHEETDWQARRCGGYRVRALDITAFWRPKLKGCVSKHFYHPAGKALPGILVGMAASIGCLGSQRVPLPTHLLSPPADESEAWLKQHLIEQVAEELAEDEVAVLDAGFSLKALQEAQMPRYVIRLPRNAVARRNQLPERAPDQKGRPREYGDIVRPLARCYRDKCLAATPCDHHESWDYQGRQLHAEIWDELVRHDCAVDTDQDTYRIVVITDPLYLRPWVLASNLTVPAHVLHALFLQRWPIEQLPLAAKHMIGAHRQFVFSPRSRTRLPQLALLAGAILTCLAALFPAIPTGFWDRQPKPTPGRLRRALHAMPFPDSSQLPPRIRQKASVTDHLPKGIEAHRRSKPPD